MYDHLRSVQNGSVNNGVARKDSVLPRLVDTEHTPRTKDMKVLVLGMCRTGTRCKPDEMPTHTSSDQNHPLTQGNPTQRSSKPSKN